MDSNTSRAMPHSDVVPGVIVGPWLVRERWDHGSFGVVFRVERAGHPEAGSFALKLALNREDARFKREVTLLQSRRTRPCRASRTAAGGPGRAASSSRTW